MTIDEFNALPLIERQAPGNWPRLSNGCADLVGANLGGANLRDADLLGADLRHANLWGADLQGARYAFSVVLRAAWGGLPDALTLELMRQDAEACGEDAMTAWAAGGDCPFARHEREFYFAERRELWVPGPPTMTVRELWAALCETKEIKQDRV